MSYRPNGALQETLMKEEEDVPWDISLVGELHALSVMLYANDKKT